MKFKFRGYEIEIKAKNAVLHDRANKHDTLAFMNQLLGWFYDSIHYDEQREDEGLEEYTERQYEYATELYKQLAQHGLYDNLYSK